MEPIGPWLGATSVHGSDLAHIAPSLLALQDAHPQLSLALNLYETRTEQVEALVSRMRGWCRKCAAVGVDRCALSDFGTGVIRGERARRSLMARVMASCARHRLLN